MLFILYIINMLLNKLFSKTKQKGEAWILEKESKPFVQEMA